MIAPSVSVPVLSVKSTSMLPRSSMVTSRFTSTLRRASSREPVDRLTLTMAGSSCGVIPIAIASENSSASITGRDSATLMTKIETVSTPATRTSSSEKSLQPDLERGLGRPLAEPDGDLAERGRRSGRDDHAAGRALVHDRAHERARRRSTRRVRRSRRRAPTSRPASTRR